MRDTIARRRRLAMAQHMGLVPTDTRTLDRDLIQSFNGKVVQCPAGKAAGTHALHTKKATTMNMTFWRGTRYGG